MQDYESAYRTNNCLSEEEVSFSIFKHLRELESYKKEKIVMSSLMKANKYYNSRKILLETRRMYFNFFEEEYNNILNNWLLLAKELKLNTSVELSILFSYLLWNGYFSKNFAHRYNSFDRKNITGLFSLDVFNGVGVCLNYSDMLRDFLSKSNIDSALLVGSICNFERENNANKLIERKSDKDNILEDIISKTFKLFVEKNDNHALVLICDNDKIYIYDPTNLFFGEIISNKLAKIIDGIGTIKLNPYKSYELSIHNQDINTLDKLFNKNNYNTNLTKDSLNKIWLDSISLLNTNSFLLKDCYKDTVPDIIEITKKLKRIK